jgi:hypothetical protein
MAIAAWMQRSAGTSAQKFYVRDSGSSGSSSGSSGSSASSIPNKIKMHTTIQ